MSTVETPILDMLAAYCDSDPLRFHMPGHKGRLAFPAGWDITEIAGSDDLHMPEGVILRAQQLAAQAWGAQETCFLVNGSSVGLLAMLWALPRDRPVLVMRDCHKAVLHGLILTGLRPIWLWPEDLDVPLRLDMTQRPSALILTRPDYYGRCLSADTLADVARLLHAHDAYLLVDEAHGAHLAFSSRCPDSCAAWADVWVQSAHKTLPALTQSAYLHIGVGGSPLAPRLRQGLMLLQSSSPSYLLLAGLDHARAWMQRHPERLEGLIDRCEAFAATQPGAWPVQGRDPTRLVVEVGDGYAAQQALDARGVRVEMADTARVVCIASVMDEPRDMARLAAALDTVKYPPKVFPEWQTVRMDRQLTDQQLTLQQLSDQQLTLQQLTPQQAAQCTHTRVRLQQSAGRICGVAAGCYPPGIPLLMPGERIDPSIVAYMLQIRQAGGRLFGVNDEWLEVVA